MTSAAPIQKDFFISYNGRDRPWAEWIAWILEEAGYQVVIQAWDFRPGGNFVLDMQRAARCQRTIAVVSPYYLEAEYTQPEWAAAYKQDPQSLTRKLIPIRVVPCEPDGLLAAIVYVDLVDKSRDEAKQLILAALEDRAKPEKEPDFPGEPEPELEPLPQRAKPTAAPMFPGEAVAGSTADLPNPFQPLSGGIEEAERFFNCDRTLERIFELLNAGSSVALIGPPNLGKSSLLWAVYRLAATRLQSPRQPVRLNLANVFSEQDFCDDLCEALAMETIEINSLARALRKQRLLLLLDEVERISQEEFTRRIREQLRGLAEGRDAPLRLVITARTSLDQLFPDSYVTGEVSPLEGICIEEHLQPWSAETSRQFILHHLSEGPVQFTEAEIAQLVETCQGNPKTLMRHCHELYQAYRERLSGGQ